MAECKDTQVDQVHGKVDTAISGEDESEVCEPCKLDNNIQPAAGWCETCDEKLCDYCYRAHCRQKSMRHHQLMSIDDMKSMTQRKMLPKTCEKHDGKPLEYFCEDHTELGCSPCFVTKHRLCNKVAYIADVKTNESEEFKTLENLLSQFDKRLKANEETVEMNLGRAARQNDEAIADIKEAGDKLKAHIDGLVKQQILKAQKRNEDNMRNMGCVRETNKDIAKKFKDGKQMFTAVQGDNTRLFVAMKYVQREVKMMNPKLTESEKKNVVREYEFELSSELADVLEKVKYIGTLKDTQLLNLEKATEYEFESSSELADVLENVKHLGTQKDTQLLNPEKATDEVVDVIEVKRSRTVKTHRSWGSYIHDAIQVSIDHDIQLLHVLVFARLDDTTRVSLSISEGDNCLMECSDFYEREVDQLEDVAVNMVKKGGAHGITLQAGHQYVINVTRGVAWRESYYYGRDALSKVTAKGVTVTFRNTARTNSGHSLIAGLRFAVI